MGHLLRAIASFPGMPDAHYHRARELILLGQEGEALKALDDALQADRGFVPARVLRAMLQAKPVNRGEARSADAPPPASSIEEVWRTAFLSVSEHRWKEAAEAYSKLLKLE